MENQIFDAQMERLKLVIRKHTATDLADFFGVPESTVSAAVRRGKMPSSWLVILMRVKKCASGVDTHGQGAMPYDAAARAKPLRNRC